jgi:glycosyltransferase involved in cell wall biosynthesis
MQPMCLDDMVVVEAMTAGLPCVVSDVCGLRELVDDTVGKVVDAEDAQVVAKALMTAWPRDMSRKTRARPGLS